MTQAQKAATQDAAGPLKTRIQHLQADAREVLSAVKKDYEQARQAVHELQLKSELKAFVQARLKPSKPESLN